MLGGVIEVGKRKKNEAKMLGTYAGCSTCENAIPIGGGDHVCEECGGIPVVVLSDYAPTDQYLACKGKAYTRGGA